ncbi:hypothetical protein H257_11274 [Aphanomyces astaci]|uniref:Uncharacterized protein n=1 Tax=Aphanomyces astaci TaxID=112090 RepID=W4G2L5_APHAT|nr:hypothetical protein H257_11274 [Aphanomyces astaci]ETV73957.1 hypothetical protein H257_11274 [Aphanomyces astaci]|eukprot:XP_009836470.1 hypothetical protein H257_11274 [Aphanomyces astaci]
MIAPTSSPKNRVMVATGLATPVTTQERAELYGGVAYLLLTLCGTVWYMFLLSPTPSNNFPLQRQWLRDVSHRCRQHQIVGVRSIPLVDLFSADAAVPKDYPTSVMQADFAAAYSRRVFLSEHASGAPVVERPSHLRDAASHRRRSEDTRYDLTWQIQLVVGITETVENALGFGSAIKSLPVVYGTWTSLILFWNFLNNMYTCYYFNASLIRGSDNHFGMIGLPIEDPYGMQDADGNYVDQSPPAPLLALITDFHTALFGQAWVNPAYNAPTSFPQKQLSYYDNCGSQSQFIIIATNQALVFALFASGAIDIYSICALQASDGCDAALIQAKAIVDALGPLLPSPVVVADVVGQLPGIHFFQYAQNTSSND